jgi:predicted HTH transcriptional regulator
MKEVSESTIEQILQGNSENLNLEFKSTFDFNKNIWARERLIRSILAMSNTRNGGYILIGVAENGDKSLNLSGIDENHLQLFKTKVEDLKSKVESFSSSPVSYEVGLGKYKRNEYILISVTEFLLSPQICRKNGEHKDKILEEGALYIRTLKDKPSSIKLTNPVDIQDFLERATDKQISNLHKRGWKHDTENLKNAKSSFEKERANF